MRPITPAEVQEKPLGEIPDFVFDAFNELIEENFRGNEAYVGQEEVVEAILRHMPGEVKSRSMIFKYRLLEIEEAYRKMGWVVKSSRAAPDGNYKPHFTFKKPHTVQYIVD